MSTNTQIVVVEQQREPFEFGFVPVMIVCGMVALVVTHFWQIVAVSALILAAVMVLRAMSTQERRERGLRERADRQDRMFAAGDPRGVFGDSGSCR